MTTAAIRTAGAAQATTARRVLMLCYYYPPLRSSGTTRSVEFARRLPEHGWRPTVLTARNPKERWAGLNEPIPQSIDVRRTLELDLHGLVDLLHGAACRALRPFGRDPQRNWFRETLCVPDAQVGWQTTLAGARLARAADLVYASCSPFSSALSACAIKRLTGRPVVLDFRDPWSMNAHHRVTPARARVDARLERRVVRACDALIVNTEGAADLYRAAYPEDAAKVSAIPNGYDVLDPAEPRRIADDPTFRVMHVGNFYGARRPDRLLEVLAALGRPDVEFVQVGGSFESLPRFADRVRIRLVPSVPRDEALRLMKTASLLYLAQGDVDGPADVAVGAKTYEYLATGLPILADCPPGDNAETVRRFASYPHVVTSRRTEDLAAAVSAALAARNETAPHVRADFVERYDRGRLTGLLARAFERAVARY